MAEARRVPLLPVKDSTNNGTFSPQEDQVSAKLQEEEQEETIRLEICLSDSTERGCPEFSYLQKIKGHLKKAAKLNQSTSLDPFEVDDTEKLEILAKKFEEKYGPKPSPTGKKRKHSVDPLYQDIGYGYDETDPFVDNSEAYDELIPSNWTTQHGGFYINQGELRFKTISDEDSKDFKSPKKKNLGSEKKKLKMKTDEKSLSKTPKELSTQKRKKQLLNKEKHQKKLEGSVLQQNGKKRKKKINTDSQTKTQNIQIKSDSDAFKKTENIFMKSEKLFKEEPLLMSNSRKSSLSTSPVLNHAKQPIVKLDNFAKSHPDQDEKFLVNSGELLARKQFIEEALASSSDSERQDLSNQKKLEQESVVKRNSTEASPSLKDVTKDSEQVGPPQLPENLPLILEAGIQNLTEAARNCSNGKCRFFDTSVNKTLLSVARALSKLPCKLRTAAYDYLAYYLPCSKETLIKRAKSLMIEHQVNQLDEPIMKLKDAIEKAMPQQKKVYDTAVANALTEQVREQMKQSGFQLKVDPESSELPNESQESLNSSEQPMTPTESSGKKNIPKRKFSWSDEIRDLLCQVVNIKVQLYKMSKSRSMTAEEYIKDFLENDVRKLWPKGWMTSRILFKESKAAHQEITQPVNKVKKAGKKPELAGTIINNNSVSIVAKNTPSICDTSETSRQSSNKISEGKVFQCYDKTVSLSKTVTTLSAKPGKNIPITTSIPFQKSNKNDVLLKARSLEVSRYDQTKSTVYQQPDLKKESHQICATTESNRKAIFSVGRSANAVSQTGNKTMLNQKPDHRTIKTYGSAISEKPASLFDERARSILDYAAGCSASGKGDSTDIIKAPKPIASVSYSLPERSLPYPKIEAPSISASSKMHIAENGEAISVTSWGNMSSSHHSFSQNNTTPSRSITGSLQPTKIISPPQYTKSSDASMQYSFSPKHDNQHSSSTNRYKNAPKESKRSKSTTPPKNSVKNISPQHNISVAITRTSPLVHFPTGLDNAKRVSSHSPEAIRRSPIGISYSVSRMTNESPSKSSNLSTTATFHSSFDSFPFSTALSSLSSSTLAASNNHTQALSRTHMQSLAAMQQAKQMPSQAELLFQQQQQQQQQQNLQHHLKQHSLLQQQQHQLQKQHMQQRISNISNPNFLESQGPFPLTPSLSIPNMVNCTTNQNMFSSVLNPIESIISYQGSTGNPECYPNPFPTFRPQFS